MSIQQKILSQQLENAKPHLKYSYQRVQLDIMETVGVRYSLKKAQGVKDFFPNYVKNGKIQL